MEKGVIYKITNPNGFIYIGKTKNHKNRFNQYKNLNCKSQPALYNSIYKYGFENHKIEILESCDLEILSQREIFYIDFFNSFHGGLNCTFGGDDGFLYGEYNVAKKKEVRDKMSKSRLEYYKNNDAPMKGKKHSIETIDKIKEKRANQKDIIRCLVFDLETGDIYYSIKELAELLNIKYKSFFYKIKYTNFYQNKYKIVNVSKAS